MKPFSVLLSNETLIIFERKKKNLCSLSLVCSQHVITYSLLFLNQPVWGARGLLGSSSLSVFFSVEFEVLPTPLGSSLSLTSRLFLSRREEKDTSLDPCQCMSMVLGALLLRMPLLLTRATGMGTYIPAVSQMSQWYHLLDSVFCRTHLFGFLLMFCLLFLFSTFYDEVSTCEL